jgi:hypothetical protein
VDASRSAETPGRPGRSLALGELRPIFDAPGVVCLMVADNRRPSTSRIGPVGVVEILSALAARAPEHGADQASGASLQIR